MLDKALGFCAGIGGWMGFGLVIVVCYDVITRYFGVGKFGSLTSTMIQEFEYWLHTGLIVFCVGYAYTKQAHVRIDLLRERFSRRTRHWIEAIGLTIALIPYSLLGVWLSWPYVVQSYTSGEISKSQTGLGALWIVKAGLIVLFFLMLIAGISQLIKAIAGIRGELSEEMNNQLVGEEL